jgi:hypothetical protein
MTLDTLKDIEKFEADLWEASENLRANSKLTSSKGKRFASPFSTPISELELVELAKSDTAVLPRRVVGRHQSAPGSIYVGG